MSPALPLPEPSGQLLLTVAEACRALRISKWSFYQLLHRRQLATVTIGKRRFVSPQQLEAFLQHLAAQQEES